MGKLIAAIVVVGLGIVLGRVLENVADRVRVPPLARAGATLKYVGVGIAALILLFSVFVSVDVGHVGVVTVFGRVEPEPLYNGLHLVLPWKDVHQLSIQIQKAEAKYDAASADIQAVHTVMAINYAIRPDRAPELFRTVGLGYAQSIIGPAASEVLKANTALHQANEILKQRAKIKIDVQNGLSAWLAKYGIDVKEVSIRDIHFDPDFEKAVERKQIAQQLAEQKRYEVEQAVQTANAMVAQRRGEGEAAKAKAEGDAAALRITASAQAEYNRQVSASLTPTLIQKQYLDRWNGILPQYVLGSGSNVLLGLPNAKANAQR